MDAGLFSILALAALAVGALLGWLIGSREGAQAKSTVESLRLQLNGVTAERNEAVDRCNSLQAEVAFKGQELAAINAAAEERQKAYEAQLQQIRELDTKLETSFGTLAGKALQSAHDEFLKRAAKQLENEGKQNEANIKAMLQPVELTLKRYEEGLTRIEKEREGSYRELNKAVELLHSSHSAVKEETARLVNALRSNPKTRGNWGEQSLKNVLEQAGLNPHSDYKAEVSVDSDDGRLRPDVIVRLPGGGQIVIDAKCSLNAYLDACDEVDDDKRKACLKAHLASVKNHVQKLASKSYWEQFGNTADFVIMYIPGEHFLTAALEQDAKDKNDPPLWDWARDRRVLLASPTNLLVIARLAASYWRQDQQNKEAAEIAKLGRELHARVATMAEHVWKVGSNLNKANLAYNSMVGSLESQVFTQARRFEAYGVSSTKQIVSSPDIKIEPRPLTKLASGDVPPVAIFEDQTGGSPLPDGEVPF